MEREDLADLARLLTRRVVEQIRIPTVRPATIVATAAAGDVFARIQPDGPTGEPEFDAHKEDVAYAIGDRVLVLFVPPHGAYVVWRFP